MTKSLCGIKFFNNRTGIGIIIVILQISKLMHREVKELAQCQSQEFT